MTIDPEMNVPPEFFRSMSFFEFLDLVRRESVFNEEESFKLAALLGRHVPPGARMSFDPKAVMAKFPPGSPLPAGGMAESAHILYEFLKTSQTEVPARLDFPSNKTPSA